MADIKSIAPSLFRVSSLLAITFNGPWRGEVMVKEEHLDLIDISENPFVKNGELILLPSENLKVFEQIKRRTDQKIRRLTRKFIEELPQIRLLNNLDIPEIDKYLLEERENYHKAATEYVEKQFPLDVEKRKAELSEKFPRLSEHLGEYYISSSAALAKCRMKHLFFKVEDVAAFSSIMREQESALSGAMSSFVSDLAKNFRETAVEACLAFKKGMDRAGAAVDSRSVTKFKEWLGRFERQDLLGDTTMRDLLNSVKTHVFEVQSWATEGNAEALASIRKHLDGVIAAGSEEGAALGVADRFCRVGDDVIDLDSLDVLQKGDS